MSRLFALFQTDVAGDFTAPSGLATLAKYSAAVLQAEMASVKYDSQGRAYADGTTPTAWLEAKGVEPWLYVNPYWQMESRKYGGPGEAFRRAQALQIELADAWLRTSPVGTRIPVWGGKMLAIDVRNLAYRDWLRLAVPSLPGKSLFIDCGFYHTGAYHQGAGGPDAERAAVIRELYQDWRAQGMRLVVNAGWEAIDPNANKPTYPFADYVDGVAIECPGGQDTTGKFWDVVSYRNVHGTVDLSRLRRVVADWQARGKAVWLVCVWQRSKPADYTYSPFPTFEEHADFWLEAAQTMGCDVSVFADTSHAVWRENWTAEWGADTEVPPNLSEQVAALAKRVSRLEMLAGF